VGITELISEFAKLISFSFRLFGNIFAGEVMLLVLSFLLPLILTIPFLGLEVFIGLIQAFIFYILTLAFFTSAIISHDHGEEHH
jgi:F-type H+-transporting ATPase subunit a